MSGWDTWDSVSAGRDDSWLAVADAARGTTLTPAAIAEQFGVDEHEVEERLSDLELETCPGCGWWVDAEGIDEEGYCEDCQESNAAPED